MNDINRDNATRKVVRSAALLLDSNYQNSFLADKYKYAQKKPSRIGIISSLLNMSHCCICSHVIMTVNDLGKCRICGTEEPVVLKKIDGKYLDFFIKGGIEEVSFHVTKTNAA